LRLLKEKTVRQLTIPEIHHQREVEIGTRDRTALIADIYRPAATERSPVLLQRTPYGRVSGVTETYAHPSWYATRGFAVVCQDVRGCGDSDGIFNPFHGEAEDGADTISWIAQQPWCNGSVGTYGFSYPGVIQLLTAALKPPALRAIAPAMATSDVHTPWLFRGGAFQLGWTHRWLCDLGVAAATRAGDHESARDFTRMAADPATLFGTLPVSETFGPRLRRYIPFLEEWLSHPQEHEYWRAIAPRTCYAEIDVPALHVTGWYDTFLDGAIENFHGLREEARAEQMLIAGPWMHVPWQRTSNGVDFGQAATSPVDEIQVAFFRRWLRDSRDDPGDDRPVRVFVMGEQQWRSFSSWPPPRLELLSMYLVSDGRANSSGGNGRLTMGPSRRALAPDAVVCDPGAPVSLPGGRSCCYPAVTPMGPEDQREQHQRNDVLIYQTGPLGHELTAIGSPRLIMFASSDAVSADFVAQLSVEDALGRWINVSDGNIRITLEEGVNEVEVRLSYTAFTVSPGHGLRLAVAGSSFPTLDRNPHTGGSALDAHGDELTVATHLVFHDFDRPSRLELPLVGPRLTDHPLTLDSGEETLR
jgi:putative CocE/NonD family hydrolase